METDNTSNFDCVLTQKKCDLTCKSVLHMTISILFKLVGVVTDSSPNAIVVRHNLLWSKSDLFLSFYL